MVKHSSVLNHYWELAYKWLSFQSAVYQKVEEGEKRDFTSKHDLENTVCHIEFVTLSCSF